MPKITKRVVDAATAKAKRYIVWDGEIKGFGLLVLPTGIKSYVFNIGLPRGGIAASPSASMERGRRHRPGTGRKSIGKSLGAAATPLARSGCCLRPRRLARFSTHISPPRASRIKHLDTSNRPGPHRASLAPSPGQATRTSADGERYQACAICNPRWQDIRRHQDRKQGRARVKGGEGRSAPSIDLLRVIFNCAIRER